MADTNTIPTPATSIAKQATARATMDLIDDAAHLDGAAPRQLSPGDADELIARMADAQIDQMLADDEAGKPPVVARPPVEPTIDPLDQIDAMLAADEAATPPPAPKPAPPAAPAVDPLDAIDAMLAADEATAAPVAKPAAPPAAPSVDPLSAIDAMLAADEVPATPAAEVATMFPASFSPPQSKRPQVTEMPFAAAAPIEATPLDAGASSSELKELLAAPAEPAVVESPAHELQSSADAVAAELAADARLTPPRPTSPPVEPPAPAEVDDEPHGLRAVPVVALELINYPVRGLSDSARELMGAIAIVTLANATALLLYLLLFRA